MECKTNYRIQKKLKTLTSGIEKLTNAQNEFVSKFHGFGEGLGNAKVGADKLKTDQVN